MSAPVREPMNAYPLASAVVRGASRAVPFCVQLFRPGEEHPYAETELMGWELEPPAEDDPANEGKFRTRPGRLILKVEISAEPPPPVVPDKRAGHKEPAPPNTADGVA